MLLTGSELTKKDRESQLYDEFEHFKMLPGENINEYYVRFHKLVNDMRNIRMTMPNIQLNSKFDGRIVVQNVQGRHNQNQRNFARGAGAAGNGGAHNRARNANACQGKPIKCYNCNGLGHIVRNCTQPKRPQNSDFFKDKMLLMQAQENGAVLDEEELLFLAGEQTNTFHVDVDDQPVRDLAQNDDNIFQADECDAFESDVDDEPTAHNVIPYEQYLTINEVSVEPNCASSVPNDAYVLHDNNAYIPHDPLVTEINIYKQQVAMYEQRAKFDLTLREQRMNEQMSILIQDRNKKEEKLKKELHSVKDTLGTTPKGGVILGPERPRTYDDLNDNDKKRFDVDVRATNIMLQ
ncbi:retrovirus-related pol polyprotein from transposon TNT 1-94 [Tanacetum coccineum]